MEELFNNLAIKMWGEGISEMYENSLSFNMIEEAIKEVCNFFQLDQSVEFEHNTIASLDGRNASENEFLYFGSKQFADIDITGQDMLDLEMTHLGTCQMLQEMGMDYNSHQEILCSDYMAGVRAGMNCMNASQLIEALGNTMGNEILPDGPFRVAALQAGLEFSKQFGQQATPTFCDCLNDFKSERMYDIIELEQLKSEMYSHECSMCHYQRELEREPENERLLHLLHQCDEQYNFAKLSLDRKYSEIAMRNLLSYNWFNDALKNFELSNNEILQSVHEASEFFNLNDPQKILYRGTTGVVTRDPFTENDDVLLINRRQLLDLGINDKDGFDLVMTHEATHRMLQSISHSLASQQEEICCDYMTGVRAGLNHMDVTSIINALAYQPEGSNHPNGSLRIEAIIQGYVFGIQFNDINGHAPTFNDCYDHFCDSFPERHSFAEDYDNYDIKEYTEDEIKKHINDAQNKIDNAKSRMVYYANWARKHGTNNILTDAESGLKKAQGDYNNAQKELKKWERIRPDKKSFVEVDMFMDNNNSINENLDTLHEYSSDVSNAAAKVENCQRKVNSLHSKLNSVKLKYGIHSEEYRNIKNEYDKAQTSLSNARDEYKRTIQNAHFNGSL